jgi:hypothetical protein
MYEDFLCFWLLWLLFIIVVFFMKNSMKQFSFACWILLTIWLSNGYVDMEGAQLSLALVLILFGAIIYFVETALSMLKLFQAFTVMVGYTALLMWAKLAPIWFFIPAYVLIPLVIVFLTLFIQRQKGQETSFSVILFGMTLGQVLFDYLLYIYHLKAVIGDIDYLIYVSLAILLLLLFRSLFFTVQHVSTYVQRKYI